MQTHFTEEQLKEPGIQRANEILRSCVHCGFCTATCPTYQVLGDELDSPRGRIYLIKDMLEAGRPADEKTVTHIDRCLSCLACMSTCPSGVHYMHLVDHAREHIEKTYKRPIFDRALRWVLAQVLPYPMRFRFAMLGAMFAKPLAWALPGKLRSMVAFAPASLPPPSPMEDPQTHAAETPRRKRVALMTGCAQRALNTDINEATIRLLTRLGCDVVIAEGAGCCGALTHHMGKTHESHETAAKNLAAWGREIDGEGLDAIVINTSGCGTTVKDYGYMFRNDPKWAERAAQVSALAKDVSEVLMELDLPEGGAPALNVTYHSACSLQHGQQIKTHPKTLLKRVGFTVKEPAEPHLCCGSAGTYNLMQPEISKKLQARKARNLARTRPDVIAAGNIGCMMQIGAAMETPVIHTVELLDWATGGPQPRALSQMRAIAAE